MLLYEALVGSRCYGTAGPDSDYDYVRVVLDTPESVLAINSEVGERGHAIQGEEDSQTYSLRRFASLVAKGTPNLITPLCSHTYSGPASEQLRSLVGAVHCEQTVQRFIGMIHGQIKKYKGGALAESRQHLVDKYGWDTKFLYHVTRLMYEAVMFAAHGIIEYPISDGFTEVLMAVRNGELDPNWVFNFVEITMPGLNTLMRDLPEGPDTARINDVVLGVYEDSWGLPGGTLTTRAKVCH